MTRLVAMRILTNHSGAEYRKLIFLRIERKHTIQFLGKTVFAAHQFYQAIHIVLHRPEVLPSIAFANMRRILIGTEIRDEMSFRISRLHERRSRIIHILIILGTLEEFIGNICLTHLLRHLSYAIIIESIFKGTRERPIFRIVSIYYIERHIPILLIKTDASILVNIRCLYARFECLLRIKVAYTFQVSINNYRHGMIAYHHIGFASLEVPHRKASVLLIKGDERFYHIVGAFWLNICEQRMSGAECIPQRECTIVYPSVSFMRFLVGSIITAIYIAINGRSYHAMI